MQNLKVEIDKNSGFCFGVVYAIEMAEQILDKESMLYCLGDIVHNDEEVGRLKRKGLKIIDHEELSTLKNIKLLIRAHGEPPSTYKTAINNNIELIDASCPVVLKLQNRIKQSFDKKEQILIYGKHGHAEIKGLLGQTLSDAIVFSDIAELDILSLPKNITLYSQTTKSTDGFNKVREKLIQLGFEVSANDTICRQVSNRDQELRTFASKFDVVLFVSGVKSSNGKVLYEVCKKTNPRTHFISKPDEINPSWFSNNENVGICGATSTPMWLMREVSDALVSIPS